MNKVHYQQQSFKPIESKKPNETLVPMQTYKVSYLDFDPARLVETQPEKKKSKPKKDPEHPDQPPKEIDYQELPYLYKYDHTNPDGSVQPVIAPLVVEFPEVFSMQGISLKPNGDYVRASIFVSFDITDPKIQALVSMDKGTAENPKKPGFFQILYDASLQKLWGVKGSLAGMSSHRNIMMLEGAFANPVHWKYDDVTNLPIPGRKPSKWFGLINYGKPGEPNSRRTPFKLPIRDEKGKFIVIDWEHLQNVKLAFVPVVEFSKIYIGGGKASIQCKIVSAMVNDIQPAADSRVQDDSLEKKEQDAAHVAKLKAQMALLESLGNPTTPSTTSETNEGEEKKDLPPQPESPQPPGVGPAQITPPASVHSGSHLQPGMQMSAAPPTLTAGPPSIQPQSGPSELLKMLGQ